MKEDQFSVGCSCLHRQATRDVMDEDIVSIFLLTMIKRFDSCGSIVNSVTAAQSGSGLSGKRRHH